MEYVSGTDLSRLLKTKGMLSITEACDFAYQAALGLEHIHQNNMVHRDLKPGNLMVTNDRQVKILDLGLALLNEAPVVLGGEVTESGQVMGTLDYMAPEQCDETHRADIRADICSLGATLFALITGQPPFPSHQYPSLLQKLNAIAHATAPDILKSRSDVPHELATMISRMLANNPADRFQTPGEVAELLLPFCSHSKRDSPTDVRDQAEMMTSELRSSSLNTASPGRISLRLLRAPFFRGLVAVLATFVLAAIAVFSVSGLRRNNGISRDGIDRLHTELPGYVIESDFGRFEPTGTDSAAVNSTRLLQEILTNPKRPDQGSDAPSPWQIFSSSVEPDLRSAAIHRAATIIPVATLLTQLRQEHAPSTRAGLLMALSEFNQKAACEAASSLSPQPFDLINLLLHWYVEDPDPEVHSCVELLLRSWQQDSTLAELRPVIEQKLIPFDGGWYQPYHVSSMVVIPGPRTAMLGSPDSEPGRSENADQMEELRTVTIPYTFAISTTEITKQQYWRMGQNYWETKSPKNPQCPVNNVHWQKAAEFCNRLSTLEGLTSADHCYEQFDSRVGVLLREKSNALQLTGYRLPTDDEWEIACRAETKTVRPDGNSNVWMKRFVYSSDEATPVPNSVACCKPNPLGLFDMIGNVSEWTQTPFLDSATKLQMRRIRGGSVWTRAEGLRSAARYGYAEEVTSPKIGFRVARTLIRRPFDLTENNGEHTNRVEILAGPPACPATLQDFSPTEFEPLNDHQVVRIGHWDVRDIPTRRFQLRNNSDQLLRLKEIPWTGDLFELEEAPPLEIPANSSVDFALRMTAKSVGERTHDLRFTIDGLDKNALPPLRIHGCLRGTVLSVYSVGFFRQQPMTADFGTVPRGARAGRRLYLYNTGDTTPEAVVTNVTGPFRLVEQLEGPIVKLQNSFRVELDAQAVGLASGHVTVELKADSSNRLTFPVKAFVSDNRSFSHLGMFREGRWLIDFNRDGSVDEEFDFGNSGDQPLTGDWNGDGICDVGVWRKNSQGLPVVQLRLRGDKDQQPVKTSEYTLSGVDHYPIVGDIDGDGKTELGCVIPASSGDRLVWAFDLSHDGIFHDTFSFGRPGDIPLMGDWNGDGRDEPAISRSGSHLNPLDRIWEMKLPDALPRRFASSLDVPLAGDWDGDGDDDFGAWRPVPNSKTCIWQFDSDGDTQPNSDLEGFGTDTDIPVVLRATHKSPNQ